MPKTMTVLRVFLASPSDVSDERQIVQEIVDELNRNSDASLGVALELVNWERDAYPGVGDDAQQVINQQIGNEYDIFIGIMWGRIGTPTARAQSGTVEETESALTKFAQDPHALRVMMYFSNRQLTPTSIDIEQFAKVRQFRERLRDESGVLYWEYNDLEDFTSAIRSHLSKQRQAWGKDWGTKTEERKVVVDLRESEHNYSLLSPSELLEIEEEGYLDLLEMGQQGISDWTSSTERISQATATLGEEMRARTAEINELSADGNPLDRNQLKRISDRSAEIMEQFVSRVRPELDIYTKSYRTALDAFVRATLLEAEAQPTDNQGLCEMRDAVRKNLTAQDDTVAQLIGFRQALARIRRMTKALNRAKRDALQVLDELINASISGRQFASEIEKSLDDMIRSDGGDKSR